MNGRLSVILVLEILVSLEMVIMKIITDGIDGQIVGGRVSTFIKDSLDDIIGLRITLY